MEIKFSFIYDTAEQTQVITEQINNFPKNAKKKKNYENY